MVNPVSIANLNPIKAGEIRNPLGRKTLGAYVNECANSIGSRMDKGEITWDDVRKMAKTGEGNWRIAALRLIRTVENADMADYEPVLDGETDIRGLRKAGVDTTAIKKVKAKRRELPQGKDEPPIVEYEREIELHDRSGADFDRLMDRTEGRAVPAVNVEVNQVDVTVKIVRGVSADDV